MFVAPICNDDMQIRPMFNVCFALCAYEIRVGIFRADTKMEDFLGDGGIYCTEERNGSLVWKYFDFYLRGVLIAQSESYECIRVSTLFLMQR